MGKRMKNNLCRRILALGLAGVMTVGLFGCGKGNSGRKQTALNQPAIDGRTVTQLTSSENGKKPDIVKPVVGTGDSDMENMLRDTLNLFGYDMDVMIAAAGDNYFYSPYSLAMALLVLVNGAGGETKQQILDMLHVNDLDSVNQQLYSFLTEEVSEETRLDTANSLWLNRCFQDELEETFYSEYLPTVEGYYGAKIFSADFIKNLKETCDRINAWVSENTGGMIPKLKEEVDIDTVLEIINAVYFNGKWSNEFEEENTRESEFYGTKSVNLVEMMNDYGSSYRYCVENGLRGLSVPYKDSTYCMNILIPENTDENVLELWNAFSSEDKNDYLTKLMRSGYQTIEDFRLPKCKMDYTIGGLDNMLRTLGMTDAYLEGADFDLMGKKLVVSEVVHKAALEIDECGTRAAAVTEIMMKCEATAMRDYEIVNFIVDHPFVFFIQDRDTGMILFSGYIANL